MELDQVMVPDSDSEMELDQVMGGGKGGPGVGDKGGGGKGTFPPFLYVNNQWELQKTPFHQHNVY